MEIYRCRKCRQNLEVHNAVIKEVEACTDQNAWQSSVLYLDIDLCPSWILESIKQASWIKGKLLCQKCKGRLGSFDFVGQKYCSCKQHTVPAVHLLKNRIDVVQKRHQTSSVSPTVHNSSNNNNPLFSVTGHTDTFSTSAPEFSQAPTEVDNFMTAAESEKEDIMINHTIRLGITNRQIPENCCGNVDVFSTSVENDSENLSNNSYSSQVDLSSYNKFEVLPVEESTPDSTGERTVIETDKTEEEFEFDIPAEITCAVCLEMYYRPHSCDPCGHMFCEHCLRQLCRQTPSLTPCPLCRNVIRKCVLQNDLTERINTQYETLYKKRRHEIRNKRKETYPLPGCTHFQYERHILSRNRQNRASPWTHRNERNLIITGCFQEILIRFAWLLLFFIVHNILVFLDTLFRLELYPENPEKFNHFLLTLTCKLVILGVIYCVKKCFYINMESQFMGQAVLFVFIFSVLWDSSSWIQCALNMLVLGSLFL